MQVHHESAPQAADRRRTGRLWRLRFWLTLAAAVLGAVAALRWPAVADIEFWVAFK